MFMSSAVLVTLRFKRIASIRVIGKPYALQNEASVRWPAACRLHAPLVAVWINLELTEYGTNEVTLHQAALAQAMGTFR